MSGLQLENFHLLIFDLDGVLADTTQAHARAFADLWEMLDIEGPPYERIAGRGTRDVIAEFAEPLRPTEARLADWISFKQHRARAYLIDGPIGYHDTGAALDALTARGVSLAVGTGASRETALIVLRQLGLIDRFQAIVTGEDVSAGKPAPDIYLRILSRSGVDPAHTLIVEDSAAGLAAGIASGAWVASVRSGETTAAPRFLGCFPDLRALFHTLGVEFQCAVQ